MEAIADWQDDCALSASPPGSHANSFQSVRRLARNVRQNPHAFYFQLLPKAFQAYEKRTHEEQPVKSEPKTVQERLRMFTDFVERCQAEKKRRGLGDTELLNAID